MEILSKIFKITKNKQIINGRLSVAVDKKQGMRDYARKFELPAEEVARRVSLKLTPTEVLDIKEEYRKEAEYWDGCQYSEEYYQDVENINNMTAVDIINKSIVFDDSDLSYYFGCKHYQKEAVYTASEIEEMNKELAEFDAQISQEIKEEENLLKKRISAAKEENLRLVEEVRQDFFKKSDACAITHMGSYEGKSNSKVIWKWDAFMIDFDDGSSATISIKASDRGRRFDNEVRAIEFFVQNNCFQKQQIRRSNCRVGDNVWKTRKRVDA